jgi:hypothetical protein
LKNLIYCLKAVIKDNLNVSFFTVALLTLLFCKYSWIYNDYWIEPYIIIGCQLALLFICYENEKTLQNINVYNQVEKLNKCPDKYIEIKLNYILRSGLTLNSCVIRNAIITIATVGQLLVIWKSGSPNKVFDISIAVVIALQALYLSYTYLRLRKYVYDYIRYVEELIKQNEEN